MRKLMLLAPSDRFGRSFFGDLWRHKGTISISMHSLEASRLLGFLELTVIIAPNTYVPFETMELIKRTKTIEIIKL